MHSDAETWNVRNDILNCRATASVLTGRRKSMSSPLAFPLGARAAPGEWCSPTAAMDIFNRCVIINHCLPRCGEIFCSVIRAAQVGCG